MLKRQTALSSAQGPQKVLEELLQGHAFLHKLAKFWANQMSVTPMDPLDTFVQVEDSMADKPTFKSMRQMVRRKKPINTPRLQDLSNPNFTLNTKAFIYAARAEFRQPRLRMEVCPEDNTKILWAAAHRRKQIPDPSNPRKTLSDDVLDNLRAIYNTGRLTDSVNTRYLNADVKKEFVKTAIDRLEGYTLDCTAASRARAKSVRAYFDPKEQYLVAPGIIADCGPDLRRCGLYQTPVEVIPDTFFDEVGQDIALALLWFF